MEVIHIILWSAIFVAAIGFMPFIKPLANKIFPLDEEDCKEER